MKSFKTSENMMERYINKCLEGEDPGIKVNAVRWDLERQAWMVALKYKEYYGVVELHEYQENRGLTWVFKIEDLCDQLMKRSEESVKSFDSEAYLRECQSAINLKEYLKRCQSAIEYSRDQIPNDLTDGRNLVNYNYYEGQLAFIRQLLDRLPIEG